MYTDDLEADEAEDEDVEVLMDICSLWSDLIIQNAHHIKTLRRRSRFLSMLSCAYCRD